MPKDWRVDIAFSDHVAVFRGNIGDNKAHSHWASQITIALDGVVEFETPSGVSSADAIYIASKTRHRLLSGFVCSIYFDPLSDSIYKTLNREAPGGLVALSREELPQELRSITADTDLGTLVSSVSLSLPVPTSSSDERFKLVIQEIEARLSEGEDVDRGYLAKLINLSPTRFSHWFVERTGVPLRSYKKWLKLRLAMDALLDGKGPMEAAMSAGFSDLAHMSREFSDSFGLTYVDAQRAWAHFTQK